MEGFLRKGNGGTFWKEGNTPERQDGGSSFVEQKERATLNPRKSGRETTGGERAGGGGERNGAEPGKDNLKAGPKGIEI